jgi:hypothetical protein
VVVVSGKYTEEVLRAPDDVLSMHENSNDVGLLCFNLLRTHLVIVSDSEDGVHVGRAHRKRSMAHQHHSRISTRISIHTRTHSLILYQLVRNLANILGSVQEELELAFEDELALKGNGAFPPKFDAHC